jgi:hypothetical protein
VLPLRPHSCAICIYIHTNCLSLLLHPHLSTPTSLPLLVRPYLFTPTCLPILLAPTCLPLLVYPYLCTPICLPRLEREGGLHIYIYIYIYISIHIYVVKHCVYIYIHAYIHIYIWCECSSPGQVRGAFQSLLTYSTLCSPRRHVHPQVSTSWAASQRVTASATQLRSLIYIYIYIYVYIHIYRSRPTEKLSKEVGLQNS